MLKESFTSDAYVIVDDPTCVQVKQGHDPTVTFSTRERLKKLEPEQKAYFCIKYNINQTLLKL